MYAAWVLVGIGLIWLLRHYGGMVFTSAYPVRSWITYGLLPSVCVSAGVACGLGFGDRGRVTTYVTAGLAIFDWITKGILWSRAEMTDVIAPMAVGAMVFWLIVRK